MSQSGTPPTSDSAGYPRENWWGDDLDGTDDDEHPDRDHGTAHRFTEGTSKTEWLAYAILRQSGALICGRTAFGAPYAPQLAIAIAATFGDEEWAESHDPEALHHERHPVELSEPAHRLPEQASDDSRAVIASANGRHRSRVCEETGYLAGEDTSAVIKDRPTEEFLLVVDSVLVEAARADGKELLASERDELRDRARRMKQSGQYRDVAILETILDGILNPDRTADN
jgi:hypothetical protein